MTGARGHLPGASKGGTREESSQARLVAREAGGAGTASVLGMGIRYAAMLCATHVLGGELYGDYTLALAVTGVLTIPALLGLAPGVLPFLSKARQLGSMTEIRA
ncbi:MAG: hypothetical protein V2A76_05420, partial [Planctomycetota bacterium]